MYRLLFEDGTYFDVEGFASLKIGLAKYYGKGKPKYMYLWFKLRHNDKMKFKEWENYFYYRKLKSIFIYEEDGKTLKHAIEAPEPFIQCYYEEGDLIVTYGQQLYADEAY